MATRLELQTLLETLTEHVYFQPPTNIHMQFPCIIYKRNASRSTHAGNRPYMRVKSYEVTVVDRNPDSELPDTVENLPYCAFSRQFVADGLYHSVFILFF